VIVFVPCAPNESSTEPFARSRNTYTVFVTARDRARPTTLPFAGSSAKSSKLAKLGSGTIAWPFVPKSLSGPPVAVRWTNTGSVCVLSLSFCRRDSPPIRIWPLGLTTIAVKASGVPRGSNDRKPAANVLSIGVSAIAGRALATANETATSATASARRFTGCAIERGPVGTAAVLPPLGARNGTRVGRGRPSARAPERALMSPVGTSASSRSRP
jgi:hypothetical protein